MTWRPLSSLFVAVLCAFISSCAMLPYQGVVLDTQSHAPIGDVFVFRSWSKHSIGGSSGVGLTKARTDENGEFTARGKLFLSIPIFYWVQENPISFYKPGYKTVITREKLPKIFMEKIPTFIDLRRKEVNEARTYHWLMGEKGVEIWQEEDFIDKAGSLIRHGRDMEAQGLNGSPMNRQRARSMFKQRWMREINRAWIKQNIQMLRMKKDCRPADSSEIVSSLIEDLNSRNEGTRLLAANTLSKLCVDNRRDLEALNRFTQRQIEGWNNKNHTFRIPIVYLGRIGPPVVEPLVSALRLEKFDMRQKAVRALAETGSPMALHALIEQLDAQNKYRYRRIKGPIGYSTRLFDIGRSPHGSGEVIVPAEGKGSEINEEMLMKIFLMRIKAYEAKNDLDIKNELDAQLSALARNWTIDKNTLIEMAETRKNVVRALKYFDAPEAIKTLCEALADHDWAIRREAAISLGYFKDPKITAALIEALRDDQQRVRSSARDSLIMIGKPAADALVPILDRLYDLWKNSHSPADKEFLSEALRALIDIQSFEALNIFTKFSTYADRDIVELAESGLKRGKTWSIASDSLSRSPDISELLINIKNPSKWVREKTVKELGRIGGQQATEAVIGAWGDDSYIVRTAADWAVINMGTDALTPLLSLLTHADSYHRWRVAYVLAQMDIDDVEQHLIRILKDDAAEVKWMAATALGIVGGLEETLEPLREMLQDRDIGIKKQAQASMKQIIKRELEIDNYKW